MNKFSVFNCRCRIFLPNFSLSFGHIFCTLYFISFPISLVFTHSFISPGMRRVLLVGRACPCCEGDGGACLLLPASLEFQTALSVRFLVQQNTHLRPGTRRNSDGGRRPENISSHSWQAATWLLFIRTQKEGQKMAKGT